MSFIPKEKILETRLKLSKVVHLPDCELNVRISKMLASTGFNVFETKGEGGGGSTAKLFLGCCIDEKGEPRFKNIKEAEVALTEITLSDATLLLKEITDLSKPPEKPGNSEGSPSAASPSASAP